MHSKKIIPLLAFFIVISFIRAYGQDTPSAIFTGNSLCELELPVNTGSGEIELAISGGRFTVKSIGIGESELLRLSKSESVLSSDSPSFFAETFNNQQQLSVTLSPVLSGQTVIIKLIIIRTDNRYADLYQEAGAGTLLRIDFEDQVLGEAVND